MERVLVFPAKLLKEFDFSNGIITDQKRINEIDDALNFSNLFYLERNKAEKDSNFKQLIPYCLIKQNDKFFCYKRTKKGNESRLHDLWSLGVGGHINPEDENNIKTSYYTALERELKEEIGYDIINRDCTINGFIYDDSNDVGKVHFGIIHILNVNESVKFTFKDPAISKGEFEEIKTIKKNIDIFENWSKLIIKNLL